MALGRSHRRLGAYLRRSLRRHCSQPDRATQDAFRILEQLESDRPGLMGGLEVALADRESFAGSEQQQLIQQIINSVAEDRPRAKMQPLGDHDLPGGEDPGESVARAELIRDLMAEVESLPEQDRRLLTEHYWHRKTKAAASRAVGLPKQRGHEAFERVTRQLAGRLARHRESWVNDR